MISCAARKYSTRTWSAGTLPPPAAAAGDGSAGDGTNDGDATPPPAPPPRPAPTAPPAPLPARPGAPAGAPFHVTCGTVVDGRRPPGTISPSGVRTRWALIVHRAAGPGRLHRAGSTDRPSNSSATSTATPATAS